jgi:hypothetical protein
VVVGFVGDQLVDAIHAAAPDGLELGEHRRHGTDRFHLAVGEPLASAAPLADQAGALEHGDVLLHRRE